MMKRIAALLMLLVICFGISGCKHKSSGEDASSSEEASVQSSSAASGSVEITIPKSADDICGSYFTENSSRLGISTLTSNGDGSVSFTINSNNKDELIRNLRILLNEKLDTLKSGNSFITSINFDRDLTTLTCLADSSTYTAPDESFFDTCYVAIVACLAAEGNGEETIKDYRLKVVFVDKDNFGLISKFRYPSDSSEAPVVSSNNQTTADSSQDETYTDDTYTDDNYTDDYYTDDSFDYGSDETYYSEDYYSDEEYYN